jgi:hypothetical protein
MSSSYINQTIAAVEAIIPVAGAGIAVTPVPSGFGLSISENGATPTTTTQTARFTTGTIASGALGGGVGGYAITFSTAFADDNYTVEAEAVINPTDPNPAIHAAPCIIAGVLKTSPGVGVHVWVMNFDDRSHIIDINVTARHD